MKLFESLIQKSEKELRDELHQHCRENQYEHDMAVKLGSLGVSPHRMNLLTDSLKKIKEQTNV